MLRLLPLFASGNSGLFLPSDESATFKRLALEGITSIDDVLGQNNHFTKNLVSTVNGGSTGLLDGPSYAAVQESAEIVRGAANRFAQIKRRALAPNVSNNEYVHNSHITSFRELQNTKYDFCRLVQLCEELNLSQQHSCHMTCAMLVRAIVDHIPPIFGCKNFNEVANNYPGASSFKGSAKNLELSLRNIADSHLHVQIRQRESAPTAVQVNFSQDLDVVLSEVLRIVSLKAP